MRLMTLLVAAMVLAAAPAAALTADEVLRLKKAGVSDQTIQLMLQQESQGAVTRSPVTQTDREVVYQAGQDVPRRIQENRRREAEKERRALEAVGNIIIDGRNPVLPPLTSGGSGGQ